MPENPKTCYPFSPTFAKTCALLVLVWVAGCGGTTGSEVGLAESEVAWPVSPELVGDAQPRNEPLSEFGNQPYTVFDKNYYPITEARNFVQRGVATWYGSKHQGKRTASGKPYDMFAMTAAHQTLPIPSWVRVTNLQNNRSVVLEINDRGPFLEPGIIAVSYIAAYKLNLIKPGERNVEVSVVTPPQPTPRAGEKATPPQAESLALVPSGDNSIAPIDIIPKRVTPIRSSSAPIASPTASLVADPIEPVALPPATPLVASEPNPATETTPRPTTEPETQAPAPTRSAKTQYSVQVGVFREPKNVSNMLQQLRKAGYENTAVKKFQSKANTARFRVLVQPIPSLAEARNVQQKLEKLLATKVLVKKVSDSPR